MFSMLQYIVSPIMGRLSDKYGRRQVLLLTMIGNILSTFIWLFARSFNVFLLARIIAGLSEGNVQLSTAIISDVTSLEKRSRSLALIGIAFAVAFTVGPALGAWFASVDLSELCPSLMKFGIYPYSMAALIGLVLLLIETSYLWYSLPETIRFRKQVQNTPTPSQPLTPDDVRRRSHNLVNLKRMMCVYSFLFSGMEFTLVFLTFNVFDYTHMQQGKLLGYMGIVSALVQGGYVRRSIQKMGEKAIALQGMVACQIGLFCLFFTIGTVHPVVWLYSGVTALAFASGTVANCLTGLASIQCSEDTSKETVLSKGRALGEFRSYGQLGRAFGPIFACTLYWMFGPQVLYGCGVLFMIPAIWTFYSPSFISNEKIKST
ncbi:major facilitator superfamily domain-containing protein [Pilobolus umbonatus]|nr:major facilitator superfamily domain-containing protein [Pilobolus umbonatus]